MLDVAHYKKNLQMILHERFKQQPMQNTLGVYIQATHGCCENRGIMATSSLTQTTVLRGAFKDDSGTKKEFFDNIKLQQEYAR